MLEKPNIQNSEIIACLRDEYGLNISEISFLPIGADMNTAVFRADTDDGAAYFVKLRGGLFDEMTIIVPKLLHEQRMPSIIAPLSTRTQELWADLGKYKVAVFPFIEGRDGYETDLLDRHWVELGLAFKALHTAQLPTTITNRIQQEQYSDKWRQLVRQFLVRVEEGPFVDGVAAELAAFLKSRNQEIRALVQRAEDLAGVMQTQATPLVLCHADIHAGNVFIANDQHLYLVDWDTLTMAPKERDLMYVGGGQFVNARSAEEEERLFYQGYGQTEANPVGLAYYRYERIVQDIAAYCEQLLLSDEGGEDRPNSLRQLTGQFGPNGVIALAYRSEQFLPERYRAKS